MHYDFIRFCGLWTVSEKGERALVLTLTKRSSEDLADYLRELKFKVRYIHSELNTFERAELIRDLRKGDVQVFYAAIFCRFSKLNTFSPFLYS